MFKILNRGISTPIAITIIFILTIFSGGIIYWQYLEIQNEGFEVAETKRGIKKSNMSRLVNITATKLFTFPEDKYVKEVIISPNRERTAYIVGGSGRGTSNFVVVDNTQSKIYDGGLYGNASLFEFSPDSQHFVYFVNEVDEYDSIKKTNPTRRYIVFNGMEIKEYESIDPHSLVFSPDSQRFSYEANRSEGAWIIIDEKEEGPYDEIWSLTFSPDSQHYTYMVEKEGKWFVVYDGEKSRAYSKVYHATFSPDSQRLAYLADDKDNEKEELFLIIDGQEFKNYRYFSDPVFSPDSQHVASYGSDWTGSFLIIDGEKKGDYSPYALSSPVFGLDNQSVAYVTGVNNNLSMVVNNKKEDTYDTVSGFSFSSDNQHYAYRAAEGEVHWSGGMGPPPEMEYKREFVVFNGEKGKVYSYVKAPLFSPNGNHLAYRAIKQKEDRWVMVLDQQEISEYDWTGRPIFSPDSQNLACIVKEAEGYSVVSETIGAEKGIILESRKGKIYDEIYQDTFLFLDDEHIGYRVKTNNEIWWIVDKIEDNIKE